MFAEMVSHRRFVAEDDRKSAMPEFANNIRCRWELE